MNHSEPERGSVKKIAFLRGGGTMGATTNSLRPSRRTVSSHGFRKADSRKLLEPHGLRRPLQCSAIESVM